MLSEVAVSSVALFSLLSKMPPLESPCVTEDVAYVVRAERLRDQEDGVRLAKFLQCEYKTGTPEAFAFLEKYNQVEQFVPPEQIAWMFPDREQWRQYILMWGQRRPDAELERLVAKDYEREKAYQAAFNTYVYIYQTKDKTAGHDIAFGLLHGWDGGKPDEFAAMTWYARTYRETGLGKSLHACQIIEKNRQKRTDNQELIFCRDDVIVSN